MCNIQYFFDHFKNSVFKENLHFIVLWLQYLYLLNTESDSGYWA